MGVMGKRVMDEARRRTEVDGNLRLGRLDELGEVIGGTLRHGQ